MQLEIFNDLHAALMLDFKVFCIMNGWYRLYVLLIGIWFFVTLSFTAWKVNHTFQETDYNIIARDLTYNEKDYFEKNITKPFKVSYIIELKYTDGSTVNTRFPILEEDNFSEVRKGTLEMVAKNQKAISDSDLDEFINKAKAENENAKKALKKFQDLISEHEMSLNNYRNQTISLAALLFLLPSAILFALGHGVAWVRRGFNNNVA